MNITLSVDKTVAEEARKVAAGMGTSLNQLVRDYLERLTNQRESSSDFSEFVELSGKGAEEEWKFNREELHERA
ncbi:MAG TPA: MerR family transcriptional regulator [Gammaproteobacteria bacterium]|jgi:hypothetical protein|nr:MerR family transcriptional regulator [Gammaproteobacteria bacterium]MBT3490213.1 MerR family transcriptional regulator [Gammaproteobacteria bacterium]MBT3719134.1 MerR family transcriptional regulator [Gammaproteobacteria bacterium]MBT3846082.1 MerR family transcriptional regulator [Gammaproteobacteria bacterium]MBT3894339.1 MerR family transcriptional regulator [Gammaproteobacteria bacterium]